MTTAFITGVSGFVGNHLSKSLLEYGWHVSGLDIMPTSVISEFYQSDLHNRPLLRKALKETGPDVIFHMAGTIKSNTPEKFYQSHVLDTVALLDEVVHSSLNPTVLIAGSSAVYGSGLGSRPITEKFTPRPATHYGVSKLAQELAALHYFTSFGLPVILVRTFNLLGPGLSPELACSAFAMQIAQAERSEKPSEILTGNLSARRDFLDVRDAVHAYVALAEKGQAGRAYNVASGQATAVRECLEFLQKQAIVPIEAHVDPDRVQEDDIPVQVGSIKRIQSVTGWEPKISLEQSLQDLLNDWRQKGKTE